MQYDLEDMINEVEIEKKVKTSVSIAKLAVYCRGLLETCDELQGTTVYSGKIRGLANRLDKEATKHTKINTTNSDANAIIQMIATEVDEIFDNYHAFLLKNYKESQQAEQQ